MNLNAAKINIPLKILSIEGNENTIHRLQELGILLHTEVSVVRKGPLAGPIILKVGTAFIAMRSADARGITVEEMA